MAIKNINFDLYHPEPLLIVISGVSGVGKDVTINVLKQRKLSFHFVVTATDRPRREGELDGVHYIFVSKERFQEMIANDELIEHALVYGQYKGIPRSQVEVALKAGKDVIMRLDVQGAARIRSLFPEAVLIFLIPNSYDEWLQRFEKRNTETEKDLEVRINTAAEELKRIREFDYLVVNAQNRLEETADAVIGIIDAEHHKIAHRKINL